MFRKLYFLGYSTQGLFITFMYLCVWHEASACPSLYVFSRDETQVIRAEVCRHVCWLTSQPVSSAQTCIFSSASYLFRDSGGGLHPSATGSQDSRGGTETQGMGLFKGTYLKPSGVHL